MVLLGFDYGRRHLGVALAVRGVVRPLTIIHYQEQAQAKEQIAKLCRRYRPELLVWGLPGNKSIREEIKSLAAEIGKMVELSVEFVDETLTSRDARKILKNRRRRRYDDDVAAALILEYFLAERG